MPRIPGLRRVFRFSRRTAAQVARDVDDELAFHLDMRAEELVAGGMAPAEAAREARRQFGDLEYTRRYCRAVDAGRERATRRAELGDELRQDVRYAARQLRRSPAFTAVAVLTLALGIGANTAVFSVVNGVLLRPLPYPRADRLVRLFSAHEGERVPVSPLDLGDWRAAVRSYEGVAAMLEGSVTLTGDGAEAERLRSARVSASFLPLVGARPVVGRAFAPRPDDGPAPREVVLSDALWRRRFAEDRGVVGRQVTLDGERYTVVGVVPRGREYPVDADVWAPLELDRSLLAPPARSARFLRVVARLKDGVSVAQAQAELSAVAARLAAQYPNKNEGLGALVIPLRDYMVGHLRAPLLVLMGAVGFVMLIACANVANLLLVRASARETELAVRTALGASRARVARQLLTESALLSLLGGAAAVGVALWGTAWLVGLAPERTPRLAEVRVDGTVLLVTLATAAATGLLFGLIPAVRSSRPDLTRALKAGGRGSGAGVGGMRDVLVVSEVALSVMLLAGAGLLIRSFARLERVDPGFRLSRAVTFTVTLPDGTYPDEHRRRAFAAALVARLRTIPGARSAAVTSGLPLSGASFGLNFDVEGRPPASPGQQPFAQVRTASPGYFEAMGIPLVRGRAIAPSDRVGAPPVAVINQSAAHRYFPGEDPIGKRIRFGFDTFLGGEIVGVVADVKQFRLDADTHPEVYLSNEQFPSAVLYAVVRSTAEPAAVMAAARAHVRALDPDLPLYGLRPLGELVDESVAQPRFYTVLLAAFAAVALVLAAVGIYGVMAYAVSRQAREIGIRVALGATAARVTGMVLREGLTLALAGTAVGVVAALGVTRLMRGLLYQVSPTDPLAFAAGTLVLVCAAALACWVPARRAARADPLVAIRAE